MNKEVLKEKLKGYHHVKSKKELKVGDLIKYIECNNKMYRFNDGGRITQINKNDLIIDDKILLELKQVIIFKNTIKK